MREFSNKLLTWIITGALLLFLLSGGWRMIWRYIPGVGRGPDIPANMGGAVAQPISPALANILARYNVVSYGTVTGSQGVTLSLAWPHPNGPLGDAALAEAQRRKVIRGYRAAGRPDVRVRSGREMVI